MKYSDVLQFYQNLVKEGKMALNTLDSVHTLLHPTFTLAVRDEIIRRNQIDGTYISTMNGQFQSELPIF